jgi:signal transduction histidine kinase
MLAPPPALIVIGTEKHRNEVMKGANYRLASLTPLEKARSEKGDLTMQEVVTTAREYHLKKRITHLGADLRNDLNNPLQEIVAMAFVASAFLDTNDGQPLSEETDRALRAINQAAQGMAQVVNNLEQKIRVTLDHTWVQEL